MIAPHRDRRQRDRLVVRPLQLADVGGVNLSGAAFLIVKPHLTPLAGREGSRIDVLANAASRL